MMRITTIMTLKMTKKRAMAMKLRETSKPPKSHTDSKISPSMKVIIANTKSTITTEAAKKRRK